MKTDYRDSVIYQGQADRNLLKDSRTTQRRPFEIPGRLQASGCAALGSCGRFSAAVLLYNKNRGLIHKAKNIVYWLKSVLVLHIILKRRRLPSQRLRFVFGLGFKFKKLHTLFAVRVRAHLLSSGFSQSHKSGKSSIRILQDNLIL